MRIKLANGWAALGKHHFLFSCFWDSPLDCIQNAGAAVRHKQELMLTQLSQQVQDMWVNVNRFLFM